jgi:fluoride ion exporter CrcB/FEX
MTLILAVAGGGAFRALSRYGIDSFIERRTESVFPWATFLINVAQESLDLLDEHTGVLALLNITASVVLGIAAVYVGARLRRLTLSRDTATRMYRRRHVARAMAMARMHRPRRCVHHG